MAQALRTVWLAPEEQQESHVPRVRSQRKRRTASIGGWMRLACTTLLVAGIVGGLITFVNTYARIAEYEMKCDALKKEYAQLNRECVELNLDLERMATRPRLAKVAQNQGLVFPEPEQVHYLKGTPNYPGAEAASAESSEPKSWAQRSGQQVVAALGSAWQALGGGTSNTAYAQD